MRGGQYQALLLVDTLASRSCQQTLLAGEGIRSVRPVEPVSWRAVRQNSRACDLIHAHDAHAHTLAALHSAGKPVVVSRRVAFTIRSGFFSRWKYRQAAHFLAISQHVALVLRTGGVPAGKISVVSDASTVPPDTQGAASLTERGPGDFLVVSPSLDDPLKCRDLAVRSCERAGVSLRLSEDLKTDLRCADAMLYLSRSEGLGSALLLAMSMGVPAVGSSVGGIPEVIDSGKTGLLVENDVEAVSRALVRLQSDTSLRLRMGRESVRRVQKHFTPERMADRTMRVYRQVLSEAA